MSGSPGAPGALGAPGAPGAPNHELELCQLVTLCALYLVLFGSAGHILCIIFGSVLVSWSHFVHHIWF